MSTIRANETMTDKGKPRIVLSRGQMVIKGEVAPGNFIKTFSIRKGGNGYFKGSWEELTQLVKENFDNNEPGTGSVDGDTLLINLPPEGFMSPVVEITDENRHLVIDESYARREGEKQVTRKVLKDGVKVPANFVQVVVYRADVLAQDDDRSSLAEWEMVAILAKVDEIEPMHPTTMLRNTQHEEGGTYREYSDEQWKEAYEYWENHAYIVEE